MTNKPKVKGTRFESAVRSYLRTRLADERIDRRALHGTQDMGDLYGIRAHGWEGIAECKSYKEYKPSYVARWREETLAERQNADADFALLVVKRPHRPVGESEVHMTMRDLCRVACLMSSLPQDDPTDDAWVRMTLAECCDLIEVGA